MSGRRLPPLAGSRNDLPWQVTGCLLPGGKRRRDGDQGRERADVEEGKDDGDEGAATLAGPSDLTEGNVPYRDGRDPEERAEEDEQY